MKNIIIILISLTIGLSSCNFSGNQKSIEIVAEETFEITLNDSVRSSFVKRGNKLVRHTQSALKRELSLAIKSGGLEHAIGFCNLRAIEISDSMSMEAKTSIKRVALKNRNPNNTMTEQEKEFFNKASKEFSETGVSRPAVYVNAQNQAVYYETIITKSICLNCHGSVDSDIKPNVAEQINDFYPGDKAVGFEANDLRGLWVVTFPEYIIK